MRTTVSAPLLALMVVLLAPPLSAAPQKPPLEVGRERLPGVELATSIATATGIAITPLLGVSAYGAWQYWRADGESRDDLPWYASVWFWTPGLLVALMLVFKDPLLGLVPGVKKPLDALDVLENKVSALLAAPAVVPMLLSSVAPAALDRLTAAGNAGVSHAGLPSLEGLLQDLPRTGGLAAAGVVFLIGFFCVWLAFHAINVLILLSPFGFLDTFLRSFKLLALLVLGASTLIHPYIGVVVALLILLISIPIAGWSWRLMVFGGVHAADVVFRRHRKLDPATCCLHAFTATEVEGVSPRTYGELTCQADEILFSYRPWGLLPARRIVLSENERSAHLGRGLMGPVLRGPADSQRRLSLLRFPPRYRTHEDELAARLGLQGVEDLPIRRGIRAVLAWCRDVAGKGWEAATDLVPGS